MPTVIIPPTDVSPYTGTGDQVLANTPTLVTPVIGAATGTSLALTGNITSPDHIFGTSGPSAKSSIASRAARQGLVFDGTAGATCPNITLPGTNGFTVAAWMSVNSLAANNVIVDGPLSSFALFVGTDGRVARLDRSTDLQVATPAGVITTGKMYSIAYVRGSIYVNGILQASFTDTSDYSGYIRRIGWAESSDSYATGYFSVSIYNRALSASEVVSLFEAGVPAAADYNSASNTSLLTGANSDFSSAGNWSVQGATTISGGKLNLSNGDAAYNGLALLTIGKRYRLTITVDSLTAGVVQYYNGSSYVTFASTAGTYTVEFTCAATFAPGLHLRSSGGNAVLDTALYYTLGLLLAPDAAQAGGGLTWYDTSGNAANITLPASGVAWAVPTSGKMATSLNVNAAASLFASTSNSTSISDVDTTAALISKGSGTPRLYFGNDNAANRPFVQAGVGGGALFMCIQPYGGNALFGSLTDSGNGKIQLATHTTSAGGIGFGSDASLYRWNNGFLTIDKATNSGLFLAEGGALKAEFTSYSGVCYVGSRVGTTIVQSGGNPFLTGDSSQNATFAGQVKTNYSSSGDYSFFNAATSGANRLFMLLGIAGVTNGFTVRWNHSTSSMRVNIQNIPTSSTGLTTGDLWSDGGTIKIV